MNSLRQILTALLADIPKKRMPSSAKADPEAYALAARTAVLEGEDSIAGLPKDLQWEATGDYYYSPTALVVCVVSTTIAADTPRIVQHLIDALRTRGITPGLRLGVYAHIQSVVRMCTLSDVLVEVLTRDQHVPLRVFESLYELRTVVGKTLSPEAYAYHTLARTQPVQVFLNSDDKGTLRSQRVVLLEGCRNPLFIHSPLAINMAALDANLRWHLLDFKDGIALGARGVVVHCGSNTRGLPDRAAVACMVTNFKRLVASASEACPLLIENPAREKGDLCWAPRDLIALYGMFSEEERRKVGLCIDTQHAYSAGEDVLGYLRTVDEALPGVIRLVHYNDSKGDMGCCHDTHNAVCGGFDTMRSLIARGRPSPSTLVGDLGYIGPRTMLDVAKWCIAKDIPMVTEWGSS